MKVIIKTIYFLFSITLLLYLGNSNPHFPDLPPDSVQSQEPGDTETLLRRAYFTNLTREEVMRHYMNQLANKEILGINIPTYRLNYPPEEAQILIRDQTRSTFLEEVVHPLRESLYVNGFKPTEEKDKIIINGRKWHQKITVRLVPSNIHVRLLVGLLTILAIPILSKAWIKIF